MSEDLKKHVRTQGKYSDMSKIKNRDKRQKISPSAKEPPEKKNHNRYSNESNRSSNSFTNDDVSPVKYEENSDFSFEQLEDSKKSIEIINPGEHIISTTNNGDSTVVYEPEFLKEEEADEFLQRLHNSINWYSKNIIINGEEYPQPRLVAWFGPYPYSYSGTTLEPLEMPDCVLEVKSKVEEYLREHGIITTFNSVLLNLYRNGKDSVAWHSDDELSMGICPTIASVSLGETRRFEMRPKKKYSEDEKQAHFLIHLTHGSLLIMDGSMQDDWQHRVPKEYHDRDIRINLTFRTVYSLEKISYKVPVREFMKEKPIDDWNSNKTISCKVNFDDEDFPPLSSDTTPSSSGVKSDIHNSSSNSSLRNDDFNRSCEIWDSETSFDQKLKVENHILDFDHTCQSSFATSDVKYEKIEDEKDMLDYDLTCDSSLTTNDVKYAVKIENDSSIEMNSVDSHLGDSVESPSNITEERLDNKKPPKMWLNVLAKEFVPTSIPLHQVVPNYNKFSLEELLHYEVKLMNGETLWDFAYNLKLKVTEKLPEFMHFIREELEFLCLLTDGSQTEKNQKLITSRMVCIILKDLKRRQTSPNVQKSYDRRPRSHSFGKQSHTDRERRSFQNQGRSNTHRY